MLDHRGAEAVDVQQVLDARERGPAGVPRGVSRAVCDDVLRGALAFLAMLWLVWVLPFPELLRTLRRFRAPDLFVALVAFMHRFSFLLLDHYLPALWPG